MAGIGPEGIFRLVTDNITEDGVSVHQIVCKTGLDHRTVKRYVNLLVEIQRMPKFVKKEDGLRIVISKRY